MVQIHFNYTQK